MNVKINGMFMYLISVKGNPSSISFTIFLVRHKVWDKLIRKNLTKLMKIRHLNVASMGFKLMTLDLYGISQDELVMS